MSTASASQDDDDVVTMEMVEPDEPRGPLVPAHIARWTFLGLAILAALALIAAILIVVFAPVKALTWLIVALILLVVIVIAEVVLLLLARPKRTS